MNNKFRLSLLAMLVIAVLFFACKHEILSVSDSSNTPPPAQSTCSADTVYFFNEIQPIISSNCTMSGCHDNATHAEGVNLTTYNNIMRYVQPGNAGSSKLYKVLSKGMPPKGPLTADQRSKIAKWITQGAKNNICLGSCDTALYTYSGAIKSIMQNKCIGCHNPSSLGGSIDLSTYTGVKAAATNGKLYGSVAQQSGFSAMPKNAAKLSDCEIKQIQKWVNAGAPNN